MGKNTLFTLKKFIKMEIVIPGRNKFWVYWEYQDVPVPQAIESLDKPTFKKVTTCIILQDKVEIVRASTTCAPKDKFEKTVGRKYSLNRALDILGLNREERTEFWKQYEARIPKTVKVLVDVTRIPEGKLSSFLEEVNILFTKYL